MNKVYGGTTRESDATLCLSCRAAIVLNGGKLSDDVIYCRALGTNSRPVPIRHHVSRCTEYDDKRLASRWDMEQIAWTLELSRTRKVGFVSPEERRARETTPLSTPPR